MNLKFSVAFEGSSYFSTSDPEKAAAIRACALFKSGVIREIESVPVHAAPKKGASETGKTGNAAPWLRSMQSVNTPGTGGAGDDDTSLQGQGSEQEQKTNTSDSDAGAQGGESSDGTLFGDDTGAQDAGTESGASSGLTIDEVDNYTDAVNYLRDEMGMPDEVLSRDDVAAWAASNGVTFPNFQF